MNVANSESDVIGKIDALLTRHRTGEPASLDQTSAEAQAARATIPVLTEVITEDNAIPVLTEAITTTKTIETATVNIESPPQQINLIENEPAPPDGPITDIELDETTLHQIEDFMVQELENRIALEFTATLDRALNELLDQTRDHIRLAVRVALKQRLNSPPDTTEPD